LTLRAFGPSINPEEIARDWGSMENGCLELFGLGLIVMLLIGALAIGI
jgi:hypothetical protein